MPDNLDVDTLNTAAAEAAGRSDAAGAAALLRQALDLQAGSLGPHHRDLAPTLNNLAMMLERMGDTDEAERCYRRAYDIARRGAGPNDPLVQVSRANLKDFLRASGRPEHLDADPSPVDAAVRAAVTPAPEAPSEGRLREKVAAKTHQDVAPAPHRSSPPPRPRTAATASRPTASVVPPPTVAAVRDQRPVLALVGLTLAVGLLAWFLGRPDGPAAARPPTAPPPAEVPAVTPAPKPEPPPAPAGTTTRPDRAADTTTSLGADASLCEALRRTSASWRCERLRTGTTPGAVYYYTRVKTPRDVVVRHRWTRDGAEVKTVTLRVSANTDTGFRTFSRQVLGASASGQWEVALLAPDGAIIDRQSFVVP